MDCDVREAELMSIDNCCCDAGMMSWEPCEANPCVTCVADWKEDAGVVVLGFDLHANALI